MVVAVKNEIEPKPKKKRISVRSAKNKGANFQKEIAQKICELLDMPYDGHVDSALIETRCMGQAGTDIILRGVAQKKFPYSVECKSTESWNIPKAIRQADSNKKDDTEFLLFLRRKAFKKSFVLLESDIFFELLKKLKND